MKTMHNQTIKRILLYATILCFLALPAYGAESTVGSIGVRQLPQEFASKLLRQEEAIEIHETLYANLISMSEFPKDYGGEYLNEDGQLVVQIVRPTYDFLECTSQIYRAVKPTAEKRYASLCGNRDEIVYEYVDYSFLELRELADLVTELKEHFNITGSCIDQSENQFVIRVLPDDYESLCQHEAIKSRVDMIRVEIKNSLEFNSGITGGSGIYNSDGALFSVAIGGVYKESPSDTTPQNAILTASHTNLTTVFLGLSPDVLYDSPDVNTRVRIGEVVKFRCGATGNDDGSNEGDYAVVLLDNGFTPTNHVKLSSTQTVPITDIVYYPLEGTSILKYGERTKLSMGEIVASDVTETFEGIEVNGLYEVEMTGGTISDPLNPDQIWYNERGDSGGAVFVHQNGVYKIVGCLTGGGGGYMYFSPIGLPYAYAGFYPMFG